MSQRTINLLTIAVILLILLSLLVYTTIQRPIKQARKEVIQLVSLDYPIEKVNAFYWLTANQDAYFSLDFTDEEEQERYALVDRNSGDITYYEASDLLSHDEALAITKNDKEPSKLMQARLGQLDGKVVWEVSYKDADDLLNYYYLDATNGEWIQTINAI